MVDVEDVRERQKSCEPLPSQRRSPMYRSSIFELRSLSPFRVHDTGIKSSDRVKHS
jgi:hypothetical protein